MTSNNTYSHLTAHNLVTGSPHFFVENSLNISNRKVEEAERGDKRRRFGGHGGRIKLIIRYTDDEGSSDQVDVECK